VSHVCLHPTESWLRRELAPAIAARAECAARRRQLSQNVSPAEIVDSLVYYRLGSFFHFHFFLCFSPSHTSAIGGCRRAVLLGGTGRSSPRSLRSSFQPHAQLRLRVVLAEVDVEVEVEHLRRAAAAEQRVPVADAPGCSASAGTCCTSGRWGAAEQQQEHEQEQPHGEALDRAS